MSKLWWYLAGFASAAGLLALAIMARLVVIEAAEED